MTPADLCTAPREWRSSRLLLRVPQAGDAQRLMDSFNLSMPAYRFIHWAHRRHFRPFTLEETQALVVRLQGYHAAGESLHYLALRAPCGPAASSAQGEGPGDVVGLLDLHSFDFDAPRAELGYTGDIRQARQGLMREAALAVTEIAFSLGFVRVQALSDQRNLAALAFAQSLPGFQREGVLHAFERDPWGQLSRQVCFAAVRLPDGHVDELAV